MSRNFDHGKNAYGNEHRAYTGQQAKHVLSNKLLDLYGAKPENYATISHTNYRMGDEKDNGRDSRVDNRIISQIFSGTRFDGLGGYDRAAAADLARNRISYQQQADRIHNRFEVAKNAYETTGEYKYYMIQKDLRGIADNALNCDMRQYRLSRR